MVSPVRFHRDQTRKGSGIPYIAHLLGVCSRVLTMAATRCRQSPRFCTTPPRIKVGSRRSTRSAAVSVRRRAAIVADCTDSWGRAEARLASAQGKPTSRLLPGKPAQSLLVSLADKKKNRQRRGDPQRLSCWATDPGPLHRRPGRNDLVLLLPERNLRSGACRVRSPPTCRCAVAQFPPRGGVEWTSTSLIPSSTRSPDWSRDEQKAAKIMAPRSTDGSRGAQASVSPHRQVQGQELLVLSASGVICASWSTRRQAVFCSATSDTATARTPGRNGGGSSNTLARRRFRSSRCVNGWRRSLRYPCTAAPAPMISAAAPAAGPVAMARQPFAALTDDALLEAGVLQTGLRPFTRRPTTSS